MHPVEALIYMLAAHALCDYALQGDWLSKAKNPQMAPVPGETIWPLALGSHALIQATAVHLITGSWALAACEFVAHGVIDFAKTDGRFGYNVDQYLHIGCRVLYFVALMAFGSLP